MWRWRLARVRGIDITVHATFLLVVVLGASQWGHFGVVGALFGALLTLLTFVSVTLHELGHAVVAQAFGITVHDITLYPIGGVARLGSRPKTALHELLIAIAGPAVNVVLAALGLAAAIGLWGSAEVLSLGFWERTLSGGPSPTTLLALVVTSNVGLALFNMVPALPMDGGRVLRAVLSWGIGAERATVWAAGTARVLAVGLFVAGAVFRVPTLMFIAVVVFVGAGQEVRAQRSARVLDGVQVGDAVNPYTARFTPATTLAEAVATLTMTTWNAFAVEHAGRFVGVVTRHDVLDAVRKEGAYGYVASILKRQVPVVDSRAPLELARQQMEQSGEPYVAVVRDSVFLGLLTEIELANVADSLALRMRQQVPARGQVQLK